MTNHLKRLYKYLLTVDKSAAHSVRRHFRKISADPLDAPEMWESTPEDLEGTWDASSYTDSDEKTEPRMNLELLPDAGGEVSPEEIEGIKAMLRSKQDEQNLIYDFQAAWRISSPDYDDRKAWRVLTDYRTADPSDVPSRGTIEWEMWEVKPGEYGYISSVEIPGTDRRIYGEA